MKSVLTTLFTIAGFAACMITSALAGVDKNEIPTRDAKPLHKVVEFLEAQGYQQIVSVEFDHFSWEVETLTDGAVVEHRLNPVSLKLMKKSPRMNTVPELPANGKSPQEILAIVEANNYPGVYRAISLEQYEGAMIWAIQVIDNGLNHLIGVEPVSGTIIGEKQEALEE